MTTTSVKKLAYATDLHVLRSLVNPSINFTKRVSDFAERLITVKPDTIVIGGDMVNHEFRLSGMKYDRLFFEDLVKEPSKINTIEYIIRDQKRMAKTVIYPQIMNIIREVPEANIFIIPGNQDYFAYDYLLKKFKGMPQVQGIDGRVVHTRGMSFVGIGGAGFHESEAFYAAVDAMIPGYYSWTDMYKKLDSLKMLSVPDWKKSVLVTHYPAFGHVDVTHRTPRFMHNSSIAPEHKGWTDLKSFIEYRQPLLHLTGHIHGAPFKGGKWSVENSYSVIGNRTISINPGGDELHDSGVKGIIVDVEGLSMLREKKIFLNNEQVKDIVKAL